MIPAHELRIGNLARYGGSDQPLYVTAAHIHEIERGEMEVDAIPLTPEVFKSCGFKMDSIGLRWINKTMPLAISYNIEKGPIKYIHQLQNLYFALTGTELQYKPTDK